MQATGAAKVMALSRARTRTDIVAEIGINHSGDLGQCRLLIAAAAAAGVPTSNCRNARRTIACLLTRRASGKRHPGER